MKSLILRKRCFFKSLVCMVLINLCFRQVLKCPNPCSLFRRTKVLCKKFSQFVCYRWHRWSLVRQMAEKEVLKKQQKNCFRGLEGFKRCYSIWRKIEGEVLFSAEVRPDHYCIIIWRLIFLTISDTTWDQPISDFSIFFCLGAANIDA